MSFKTLIALSSLFLPVFHICSAANSTFSHPFYHDVTNLIDDSLQLNTTSDLAKLRNAIVFSPYLFYSTDMSLYNFVNILPVIRLIQQLKPNGVRPKLIVSLKCMNTTYGTFIKSRFTDLFYNLQSEISLDNRRTMAEYVAAIVLDFSSRYPDYSSLEAAHNYLQGYTLTNSVKHFINQQFGNGTISVGIMFSQEPPNDYRLSRSRFITEVENADFVISSFDLNLKPEFPIFFEHFNATMHNQIDRSTSRLREYLKMKQTNLSVFLNIFDNSLSKSLPDFLIPFANWPKLGRALIATENYNTTCRSFLRKVYNKSQQLVVKVANKWAYLEKQDVIVRSPLQYYTQLWSNGGSKLHPFFKIENMDTSICQLRNDLTLLMKNFKALIVDEKTWMQLSRHEENLNANKVKCGDDLNMGGLHTQNLNTVMYLTQGISAAWPEFKIYIKKLVYSRSKIEAMQLNTLIFYDTDIKNSDQIQSFALTLKQNKVSIGCSLPFETLNTYAYNNNANESDAFKEHAKTKLCQPIFDSVNTFVWRVDENRMNSYSYNRFPNEGLFNGYSDVFLVREVFLNIFPNTTVLLEFTTKTDKQIISELYDASVISPFTEIIF